MILTTQQNGAFSSSALPAELKEICPLWLVWFFQQCAARHCDNITCVRYATSENALGWIPPTSMESMPPLLSFASSSWFFNLFKEWNLKMATGSPIMWRSSFSIVPTPSRARRCSLEGLSIFCRWPHIKNGICSSAVKSQEVLLDCRLKTRTVLGGSQKVLEALDEHIQRLKKMSFRWSLHAIPRMPSSKLGSRNLSPFPGVTQIPFLCSELSRDLPGVEPMLPVVKASSWRWRHFSWTGLTFLEVSFVVCSNLLTSSLCFEENKPSVPEVRKFALVHFHFGSTKICWRAVLNLRDGKCKSESTIGKYACKKSSISWPSADMETSISYKCFHAICGHKVTSQHAPLLARSSNDDAHRSAWISTPKTFLAVSSSGRCPGETIKAPSRWV